MHHPQCVKSPDDNCVNCNPKCVNCETEVVKTCADCGHVYVYCYGTHDCTLRGKIVNGTDTACDSYIDKAIL